MSVLIYSNILTSFICYPLLGLIILQYPSSESLAINFNSSRITKLPAVLFQIRELLKTGRQLPRLCLCFLAQRNEFTKSI